MREGVATPEIEFIKGASPAFKKRSLTAPQRRKRHGDLRHALQFPTKRFAISKTLSRERRWPSKRRRRLG
jgi:hypothetical protein